MNKILKPFIAFALAITLVFSMSLSVFAIIDSNDKGSITVTGLEGNETLKLYKLTTINYDENSNDMDQPMQVWVNSLADWLETSESLKSYVGTNNAVTNSFLSLEDKGEDVKSFVNELEEEIKNSNSSIQIDPIIGKNGAENKSYKFDNLDMGAYLILTSGVNGNIYNPILATIYPEYDDATHGWVLANKDITASIKAKKPTIDKSVEDENKTVGIGEVVKYTVDVEVPEYPSNADHKVLYIGDKLPEGVTYNSDSIEIYAVTTTADDSGNDKETLDKLNINEYFIDVTNSEKIDDDISLTYFYKLDNSSYEKLISIYGPISKIRLTYTATVNSDAVINDENLINTAYYRYSNDPFSDDSFTTIPDEEKVYTYELKVYKENEEATKIAGAKFELYDSNNKLLSFTVDDNTYTLASNTEDITSTISVGADGIIIKGLDLGIYTLKETEAPEGYNIPSKPDTTIVLVDNKDSNGNNGPDGTLDNSETDTRATGTNVKNSITVNGKIAEVTIVNYPNDLNLPTTGGMGTMIFTVGGILLMGGAVVLMVTASKKRKVNEE